MLVPPVLAECVESPGYGAETVIVPVLPPVKLTVQEPELSAQLALAGDTLAPVAVTLNFPVGVVGVLEVSVTVTVQLEACPITTGVAHETAVDVACVDGVSLMSTVEGLQVPPPLPLHVVWLPDAEV
jgi:hypothetical protein